MGIWEQYNLVRYLRLLANAIVTGLVGAAYLTVLLLQLNPHIPLDSRVVVEWFAALSLLYGVHVAVGGYLVMLLLEIVGLPVSAPAWISVRLQAWTGTVLCSATALLMWMNLRAFSVTIGDEAAQRMAAGAVGVSGVAIVLLSIAIIYYSVGRRGSRAAAAVLAISLATSMALPLAVRGIGERRPIVARQLDLSPHEPPAGGGRVVLILLEGASLEYLWPRAAEGRFPNFGRILDRGAAMDLATLRPTQPEPVWTAVATGKYPPKNGVPSGATYYVRSREADVELLPDYCLAHALVRFGVVRSAPHSSASWRARPLWGLAGSRGLRSGVVRWPVTYPARPINGFLISDRVHLVSQSLLRLADESIAYPSDLLPAARAAFSEGPGIAEIAPIPVNASGSGLEMVQDQPTRWDRIYGRLAREVAAQQSPDILAIRYTGLDAIGHTYLRYAMPRAFGDVPESELRTFGGVLDRYYAFLDAEVGAALEGLGPDDLLLIVSGFGMEPMTVPKRVLARLLGDARISGTHERAPDGFLLAYGARVRSGKIQRGAVVDVTPTILYFLGLPIGRDMDGYARADLFVKEFSESRPIVFIPSYDR
jgi:predicted AlkP superfamily phosphohydrolase/phosphomutase